MTSFRMSHRAIAEADVARDVLGLKTRTDAVHLAITMLYRELPELSGRSRAAVARLYDGQLKKLRQPPRR